MHQDIVQPVTRQTVIEFEKLMLAAPAALQVARDSFVLRHHFAPGVYMRELHIPAGLITTGKIHKYPCLNILAKGKRATLVDDHIEVVEAPYIHLSQAGAKRVSYTIEDAVWITVHPMDRPYNEMTNDEIERELTCNTEEEYRTFLADSVHP